MEGEALVTEASQAHRLYLHVSRAHGTRGHLSMSKSVQVKLEARCINNFMYGYTCILVSFPDYCAKSG